MTAQYKTNYGKKKKTGKGGGMALIFFLVIIGLMIRFLWYQYQKPIIVRDTTITIGKGQTLSAFYEDMSGMEKLFMKLFVKNNPELFETLQEGTYYLDGERSKGDFLKLINEGPSQDYLRYTVLEGRSLYDIDDDLAKKGYSNPGDFLASTIDSNKINELKKSYDFLNMDGVKTLEGFLYPDTYFLDKNAGVIPQLIDAQLKNFDEKVWKKRKSDFENIAEQKGLSPYQLLSLASIVEKEERNDANKPTVAGIFYNRLRDGMRLDADVTLCYGLKKPYAECTPSVIVKNISDENNVYNTRRKSGITPQPIANPAISSIDAVLFPKATNYYFYLHDNQGNIHYAETVQGHNSNKSQYIN